MTESTTQAATPIAQEVQPDIALKSVPDGTIFELYSGNKYQSLEELQDHLFYRLLRLIVNGARAELLNESEVENGVQLPTLPPTP
jgi:hypothetical protein